MSKECTKHCWEGSNPHRCGLCCYCSEKFESPTDTPTHLLMSNATAEKLGFKTTICKHPNIKVKDFDKGITECTDCGKETTASTWEEEARENFKMLAKKNAPHLNILGLEAISDYWIAKVREVEKRAREEGKAEATNEIYKHLIEKFPVPDIMNVEMWPNQERWRVLGNGEVMNEFTSFIKFKEESLTPQDITK